jgi:hypothetical protein
MLLAHGFQQFHRCHIREMQIAQYDVVTALQVFDKVSATGAR